MYITLYFSYHFDRKQKYNFQYLLVMFQFLAAFKIVLNSASGKELGERLVTMDHGIRSSDWIDLSPRLAVRTPPSLGGGVHFHTRTHSLTETHCDISP